MDYQILCASCDVCEFMPKQKDLRTLVTYELTTGPTPILVLDDAKNSNERNHAWLKASTLLDSTFFDYTSTVRCSFNEGDITEEQVTIATSRCSVWTSLLAEERKLIISTKTGLGQLKIGSDKSVGDAFITPKIGVVLCIPPLAEIRGGLISEYQSRIARALREAGL